MGREGDRRAGKSSTCLGPKQGIDIDQPGQIILIYLGPKQGIDVDKPGGDDGHTLCGLKFVPQNSNNSRLPCETAPAF